MKSYQGVIIEESLKDKSVLKEVRTLYTEIETVTREHKTPWLKTWTLHTVEVPENKAAELAQKITKSFDRQHPNNWFADYKNENFHYIIFKNKVFKVDRSKPEEYKPAVAYGLSLGIPAYQLDFSPEVKDWER